MKKVLSIMLAALMFMTFLPLTASATGVLSSIEVVEITEPVAGNTPVYNASTFTDYYYVDETFNNEDWGYYNGIRWYDVSANKPMAPTQTFVEGKRYSITVVIAAGDGWVFKEDAGGQGLDMQGLVNGSIQCDTNDGSIWGFGTDECYIEATFTAKANPIIGTVEVDDVFAPVAGMTPVYGASVSSDHYFVNSSYTNESTGYYNGVRWFDVTNNVKMSATDKFVKGNKYLATVVLCAADGFKFREDAGGHGLDMQGLVNGSIQCDTNDGSIWGYGTDECYIDAVFTAGEGITFPDVNTADWYYEAVQYCAGKGFITGYKTGNFGPADPLQRQDFVVILARIAGANLDSYTSCKLTDVDMSSYYGKSVAWAVDKGIITGYNNGKFGVGDKITREQVATILYRYMGSPYVPDVIGLRTLFSDGTQVSEFAQAAMAWAAQNGIISGKNGKLAPQDNASRAEIATIIMRMDKKGMF